MVRAGFKRRMPVHRKRPRVGSGIIDDRLIFQRISVGARIPLVRVREMKARLRRRRDSPVIHFTAGTVPRLLAD